MCSSRRQKTVVSGRTSCCSRAAAKNNGLRVDPGAWRSPVVFTVATCRPLFTSPTTPVAGVPCKAELRAACAVVCAVNGREEQRRRAQSVVANPCPNREPTGAPHLGFPVKLVGVDAVHAAFLDESRTRGRLLGPRTGKSGHLARFSRDVGFHCPVLATFGALAGTQRFD